jgi:TRAP-type C4-dicarboxylate transport system permease small subunit
MVSLHFNRLYEFAFKAGRWPAYLGGLGVVALMLHTTAHLAFRALGSPLAGTTEMAAGWYMPVIVFMGFLRAQQVNEHIEARLVFDRLPRPIQLEYQLLSYIVATILCLLLAWFGWQEGMHNRSIGLTRGVSGIVVWPATFLVPIGFVLLAIQLILDGVRLVRSKELPDEWVQDSGDGSVL